MRLRSNISVYRVCLGVYVSTELLSAESLFCERDDRILFEGLDLTLNTGEILQIEGRNGSGKTTLLRILSGLSSHFEGELFWQGEVMGEVQEAYLADLVYIGHLPGVSDQLTTEENLRWHCALHPSLDIEKIDYAIAQVGLRGFEDLPAYQLSAGQKRRIALARLYMSNARLWILDEPFTAIDKVGVAAKEALMLKHLSRGGSVILTTHQDMSDQMPVRTLSLGEPQEVAYE
jgi:heme exporter protein A